MDDGTNVLAIIGAVTGVAGFAVAFATAIRDRPKLEVTMATRYQKADGQWRLLDMQIFVANIGRQPVALTEVGLGRVSDIGRRAPGRFRRGPQGLVHPALTRFTDQPRVLPPGAMESFDPGSPPAPFRDAGWGQIFAYARDARERVTYAREPWHPLDRAGNNRSTGGVS
jgi:hypothetical protein